MKNLLIASLFILIFGGLFSLYFLGMSKNNDKTSKVTITPAMNISVKKVILYYYNPEKDKDGFGNIKCSRDGLTSVEREIPESVNYVEDTIKLLLKGRENLTQEDVTKGITTEYPLEDFSLTKIDLNPDGELLLTFDDPENKTSGGSCRVRVLWFQIEETAKQFPEVKNVQSYPDYLFQP